MRLALVLLVAATLAAGCLNAKPVNNGPADNGTGSTTTVSPTPSPSPSPGSASGGPRPSGGMLVRPAHNESSQGDFTLLADESTSGFIGGEGSATFTFEGRNDGTTNASALRGCNDDPTLHVEDENGTTLAISEPVMHCSAIVHQTLAPGASFVTNLTWNGTLWKDGGYHTVAPGKYWVVGTFAATRGDTETTLQARIPINVLDASARGAL